MSETAWFIHDLNTKNHAVPYTYVPEDFRLEKGMTFESFLPRYSEEGHPIKKKTFFPHCLYSFPNYPDGLVRTSVNQLSRFLLAYMNNGEYRGRRILKEETVKMMLSNDHFGRSLCWYTYDLGKEGKTWGHGGGDPGISTLMVFRDSDKVGAIVFTNAGDVHAKLSNIIKRLFQTAYNL